MSFISSQSIDCHAIDRIRLLVYILCELSESHNITVEKLREASQSSRSLVTPPERLRILDEIYYVRGMEERYLRGEIGMFSEEHCAMYNWLALTNWSLQKMPTPQSTYRRSTYQRQALKSPRKATVVLATRLSRIQA